VKAWSAPYSTIVVPGDTVPFGPALTATWNTSVENVAASVWFAVTFVNV
jgi:hypothetical protein